METVVCFTGEVVARTPETVNPKLATGEIELVAEAMEVLGETEQIPFQVAKEEQDRGTALTPSHAADVPADSEQDISAQEAPSVIFDGKEAAAVQTAPNS